MSEMRMAEMKARLITWAVTLKPVAGQRKPVPGETVDRSVEPKLREHDPFESDDPSRDTSRKVATSA
jgi:hypothetical protein